MERKRTFDAVAELYDRMRPTYPDALVDAVVAKLPPEPRILEIGCGTGKATRAYVDRGLRVLCLEPGPNLAAIARRNLGDAVEVVETDFESWDKPRGAFDLVLCAESWHHLDPAVRGPSAAATLKPRGTLAICGHLSVANFAEGQEAYRAWWPDYRGDPLPPVAERIARVRADLAESFATVEVRRYPWTGRYTADEYVALMGTSSHHLLLPANTRTKLFDALRACIEKMGGTCEREYEAVLYLAALSDQS